MCCEHQEERIHYSLIFLRKHCSIWTIFSRQVPPPIETRSTQLICHLGEPWFPKNSQGPEGGPAKVCTSTLQYWKSQTVITRREPKLNDVHVSLWKKGHPDLKSLRLPLLISLAASPLCLLIGDSLLHPGGKEGILKVSFGKVWELSGHRLLQILNGIYGLSSGQVFKDKIFRPISAMLSPPSWPLCILRMPLVLTPGFRCICPGMLSYPILRNTHSSSWWKSIRWNIAWFYADPSCLASSSDWQWWNSFFNRLALFLSPFIIVLM